MGPNTQVISYRFKTVSAITGFQQTLHHGEWEYFQPLSAHGPCLFPACFCVTSAWGGWGGRGGSAGAGPGSVVSMVFVCGCPGRQSWASSLVLHLCPSLWQPPCSSKSMGKYRKCLKSHPTCSGILWFSTVKTISTKIWSMAGGYIDLPFKIWVLGRLIYHSKSRFWFILFNF